MPGNKFQMFCHISCEQCHLPEVAFHGCLPWLPPRIHLPLSNAAWIKGIKTLMQQRLLIIWYNWEEMKINEVEDGEAISWAACTAVLSAWLPWPFLWWGMCKLNIMTNTLFPKLFSLWSLKICFSLLRFCAKRKKDRGSDEDFEEMHFVPAQVRLSTCGSRPAFPVSKSQGFGQKVKNPKGFCSLSAIHSPSHSTAPDVFGTSMLQISSIRVTGQVTSPDHDPP